jgi:hypothetical protein
MENLASEVDINRASELIREYKKFGQGLYCLCGLVVRGSGYRCRSSGFD